MSIFKKIKKKNPCFKDSPQRDIQRNRKPLLMLNRKCSVEFNLKKNELSVSIYLGTITSGYDI